MNVLSKQTNGAKERDGVQTIGEQNHSTVCDLITAEDLTLPIEKL